MSSRYSEPLNSDRCNPRKSSPSGYTDPAHEENSGKFSDLETKDYETYLECQNQQHYIKTYHAKTGRWPPRIGFSPSLSPPTLGGGLQMGAAMVPERAKKPMVSRRYCFAFDLAKHSLHR